MKGSRFSEEQIIGGLEVSEARRLKSLEDENRRLKKLLAEAMLDKAALKDLLGKNA
jgi:putative transposase